MNFMQTLFKTSNKSVQVIRKCYFKQKSSTSSVDSLPTFQYPAPKTSDRRVYVCGLAETGALGIKMPEQYHPNNCQRTKYPRRMSFAENHKVTDVTTGYGFSVFAVKSDDCNKVFGTGLNTDSQLGYHAPRRLNPLEILLAPAPISLPLQDPTNTNILSISAGRAHLVIVSDNEGIFTLGNNTYGQCGRRIIPDEEYKTSMIIHNIENIEDEKVIKTQCGQDHSMFLTESGKVFACGWGADGQLGRGNYQTDSQIGQVRGDIEGENIIKLSCSADCVLALSDKGDVFGWGNTEYGQLNYDNNNIQQLNVARCLSICRDHSKIIDIASGGSFCLMLNNKGNIFTWGYGILGKGPQVEHSFTPQMIPSTLFGRNEFNPNSRVQKISCGMSHMTAISDAGDLYTWGKNKYGCLGLGHEKDQFFPLKSAIGAKALKAACGIDHTVVLCQPF